MITHPRLDEGAHLDEGLGMKDEGLFDHFRGSFLGSTPSAPSNQTPPAYGHLPIGSVPISRAIIGVTSSPLLIIRVHPCHPWFVPFREFRGYIFKEFRSLDITPD